MIPLIAQAYDIGRLAIIAIVIAGIVGIVIVVIRAAGIAIPSWVIQVLWIILAVAIGVFAVKLILSFL